MSRRSARGADKLTKTEAAEKVAVVATPRKGRGVKVEEKEVLEVVTPAKSAKKIDSEDEEVEETELLAIVTPEKSNKTSTKKIKAEKGKDEEEARTNIQSKEPSKQKTKSAKATVKEKAIVEPKESLKQKVNTVKSKVAVAKAKVEKEVKEEAISKTTPKGKRKAKTEDAEEDGEGPEDNKARKKRKTKEEKEAEAMPLATRTSIGSLKKAMHIGAHVSGAGGVHNSIHNSIHIGGNSFALFLKSQRKWTSPPLAPEARDQFKAFCLEHKYDPAKVILPHGSYLVNLAQADAEKAEQAYSCFLDDLQRCEQLGIRLYNFHPGSTGGNPRPEAIARIAAQLNKAHKATKTVVTVLENMAGAGNVIGCTWEDLRDIIALIDDKTRVGVCIDTCHTFAAGYDLRTPEAFKKVMDDFSSIVGMKYLMALHLNDSKAPMASNRDLHANIGTGFLGLRAFHNVMNFNPFQGLPMVLETPIDKKGPDGKAIEDKGVWATEIKLLEGLIGADTDSEDFKKEELRLQDLGADERKKFQGQADKKKQQSIDSMFKKGKTKKAKKSDDPEDSDASEGGCSH